MSSASELKPPKIKDNFDLMDQYISCYALKSTVWGAFFTNVPTYVSLTLSKVSELLHWVSTCGKRIEFGGGHFELLVSHCDQVQSGDEALRKEIHERTLRYDALSSDH